MPNQMLNPAKSGRLIVTAVLGYLGFENEEGQKVLGCFATFEDFFSRMYFMVGKIVHAKRADSF